MIMVIGLVGKFCAAAFPIDVISPASAKAIVVLIIVIVLPSAVACGVNFVTSSHNYYSRSEFLEHLDVTGMV